MSPRYSADFFDRPSGHERKIALMHRGDANVGEINILQKNVGSTFKILLEPWHTCTVFRSALTSKIADSIKDETD